MFPLLGARIRLDILCRYYPLSNDLVEQFRKTAPTGLKSKVDGVIDALDLAVIGMIGQ